MKCRNCCSCPSVRQVLEWSMYVALALTSIYFIGKVVNEYLAEKTNFSITEESITKEDLPTITICISIKTEKEEENRTLKYGQDYTIQTMDAWLPWNNPNATMMTLSEGYNGHDFIEQRHNIK